MPPMIMIINCLIWIHPFHSLYNVAMWFGLICKSTLYVVVICINLFLNFNCVMFLLKKVMIFSQGWRGGNCQQWKEQVRFNKRQRDMDLRSQNFHLLYTKVTELVNTMDLRNASSSKNLHLLDTKVTELVNTMDLRNASSSKKTSTYL